MKKVEADIKVQIELTSRISFTEVELRALEGIFGYGPEAFIDGFYRQCGSAYVRPYEAGIRSLHEKVLPDLREALRKIDMIRNRLK